MHTVRRLLPLAVVAIAAAAILTGAAANATPQATSPLKLYTTPLIVTSTGESNGLLYGPNWAGYVATGSTSSATFVSTFTTFNVPSLNCTTTPTGYVSHWAGLDGLGYDASSSSSVEAGGVTARCVGGVASYDAWWETYPRPQTKVFSVHPGDTISVAVLYNNTAITGGADNYNFVIVDETSGKHVDLVKSCAAAACLNSSAEVVTSLPSKARGVNQSNILPVANYGTANFEQIGVANSQNQTGGFSATTWENHEAIMGGPSSTEPVAGTGTLYAGEAFFTYYTVPATTVSP
jgi:Peptidase A4 family